MFGNNHKEGKGSSLAEGKPCSCVVELRIGCTEVKVRVEVRFSHSFTCLFWPSESLLKENHVVALLNSILVVLRLGLE